MQTFIAPMATVALTAALTFQGVSLADRFMPVVVGMDGAKWQINGSRVSARITGRKIWDCTYVKGSEVGWAYAGGARKEVSFDYINDLTPGDSRPAGTQDFGRWQWSNLPDGAESVMQSVQHDCGGVLRVTLIEFPLPKGQP